MNIVDYVIIGIVAISVLYGLYRGFVSSVLNTGGCLISFGVSFWAYPKLVELVQGNGELQRTLLTYTDAASRVGDLATSIQHVAQLSADTIGQIVEKAQLPAPLSALLQYNMTHQVYGSSADTVSEYVSQTVLSACLNVICFLICFLVAFVLISIIINLIRAVFRFPVLKQMDALVGGAFGVLRGVIICFALFAVVPLVQTMVPLDLVNELIEGSTLAPIFNNGNLVLSIMNGSLF